MIHIVMNDFIIKLEVLVSNKLIYIRNAIENCVENN